MWASGDGNTKGVGLGALKSPHNFHLLPLSFFRTTDIILILHPKLCKCSFKALPWLPPSIFPNTPLWQPRLAILKPCSWE